MMAAVLVLLNTYPLLVSQDLVFYSKEVSLQSSVSVMGYSLSGLDRLTEENVTAAIAVVEETGLSRILVTDGAGLVLYDTRETGGAVGQYVLYTEIVQALLGNDAFSCTYEGGAFRSRASSPVLYQNQIIGAVYAYEYDTEQAALLEGLQENPGKYFLAKSQRYELCSDKCRKAQALQNKREFDERARAVSYTHLSLASR